MWETAELLSIEKQHCLTGRIPDATSADAVLYRAQIAEKNARKADAVALTAPVMRLLRIRAFLTRGKLKDADQALSQAKELAQDPAERTELLLEEARLACFRGDYEPACLYASRGLELGPPATTALTLLQVRALALFELGAWSDALEDLKSAEAFIELLSKAESAFYARVLLCKVLARTQGLESARNCFDDLWKNQNWSPDELLTLLRLEIDLKRMQGREVGSLAMACHGLSQHLGDQLYSALALVDLHYSLPVSERAQTQILIDEAKLKYTRIQKLCDEADSEDGLPSTSGMALRECRSFSAQILELEPQRLFFSRSLRILNLEKGAAIAEVSGKLADALGVLLLPHIPTKEEFFAELWGSQKYSPRLHDSLIWNLLSRLRKIARLEISIEDEQILLHTRVLRVDL